MSPNNLRVCVRYLEAWLIINPNDISPFVCRQHSETMIIGTFRAVHVCALSECVSGICFPPMANQNSCQSTLFKNRLRKMCYACIKYSARHNKSPSKRDPATQSKLINILAVYTVLELFDTLLFGCFVIKQIYRSLYASTYYT